MQKDELYLHDIVEAADAIQRFLQETSKEAFLEDELRQSAVLQKIIVIGEAAGRLSDPFRSNHIASALDLKYRLGCTPRQTPPKLISNSGKIENSSKIKALSRI